MTGLVPELMYKRAPIKFLYFTFSFTSHCCSFKFTSIGVLNNFEFSIQSICRKPLTTSLALYSLSLFFYKPILHPEPSCPWEVYLLESMFDFN